MHFAHTFSIPIVGFNYVPKRLRSVVEIKHFKCTSGPKLLVMRSIKGVVGSVEQVNRVASIGWITWVNAVYLSSSIKSKLSNNFNWCPLLAWGIAIRPSAG